MDGLTAQGRGFAELAHVAALKLDQTKLEIADPVGAVADHAVDAQLELFSVGREPLQLALDGVDAGDDRAAAGGGGRPAGRAQLALQLLDFDMQHGKLLPNIGQRFSPGLRPDRHRHRHQHDT